MDKAVPQSAARISSSSMKRRRSTSSLKKENVESLIRDLRTKNVRLKDAVKQLQQENDEQREKFMEWHAKKKLLIRQKEEKIQELLNSISVLKKEKESLSADVERYEKKIKQLEDRVDVLTSKTKELEKQLREGEDAFQAEISRLKSKIESLGISNANLSETLRKEVESGFQLRERLNAAKSKQSRSKTVSILLFISTLVSMMVNAFIYLTRQTKKKRM